MVGIGGLFVLGGGYFPGTIPQALGALSVLLASVNVAGGFVITKRMLDMFKRECPTITPPDLVLMAYALQEKLTHLSTHTSTPFPPSSSPGVSWLPLALAWLVSSKQATLPAAFSASAPYLASAHKLPRARATPSVCSVSAPASLRLLVPWVSPLRPWFNSLGSRAWVV